MNATQVAVMEMRPVRIALVHSSAPVVLDFKETD